jgi:hypothetical protein
MDPILSLIAELYTNVTHLSAENAELRKKLDAALNEPATVEGQ